MRDALALEAAARGVLGACELFQDHRPLRRDSTGEVAMGVLSPLPVPSAVFLQTRPVPLVLLLSSYRGGWLAIMAVGVSVNGQLFSSGDGRGGFADFHNVLSVTEPRCCDISGIGTAGGANVIISGGSETLVNASAGDLCTE